MVQVTSPLLALVDMGSYACNMNDIATATATAEWKAGYRAEALAVLAECGATTPELREFLTGLGFGTAIAWTLVERLAP